jgi:hypothetical protein
MNIYIATQKNRVGLVLTGTDNKVSYYKSFPTQTEDKQAQALLSIQRAISYVENNKVIDVPDEMNVYANFPINMEEIRANEYIKRHRFKFTQKEVETEKEKQRMLLANVEIEMETRRQFLRTGNTGR